MDKHLSLLCVSISLASTVASTGILLLYRPQDISLVCSQSNTLRYDLSYGMGMSDTITLLFRTLNEVNYGCVVEIVTESNLYLLWVIKYPTSVMRNCLYNPDAFTWFRKSKCYSICEVMEKTITQNAKEYYRDTMYYFIALKSGRVRFRFQSNSSVNTNLNAHAYQVTATSARRIPIESDCLGKNETSCEMYDNKYCFTSGVYCDGIKNCGTMDWNDEKRLDCGLPIEQLSTRAVLAVAVALCLAVLAVGHLLMRCLPPIAASFFIFNANEDNRLRIDPVFKPPPEKPLGFTKAKRSSLVPMFSSSSSSSSTPVEKQSEEEEKEGSRIELEHESREMTNFHRQPSAFSEQSDDVVSTLRAVVHQSGDERSGEERRTAAIGAGYFHKARAEMGELTY